MKRILNAILITLAAGVLLILPTGDSLQRPTPVLAASGATSTAPPNYSFDAAPHTTGTPPTNYDFETPESPVGTPPTNHDFETGDFTGWTTSGTVSVQSGGPSGFYARLDSGGTITSSAFTIPNEAQSLRFDIGTLGSGTNTYLIYILSGPGYGTETLVKNVSCSSCQDQWSTIQINPGSWRGQSVKIRVERFISGSIGVDNAAVSFEVLVDWTTFGLLTQVTGGPTGKYAELQNGTDIESPVFSVPADAQTIAFDRLFIDGSNGLIIYVASAPTYDVWTLVYLEQGPSPKPWETKMFNVSEWAGQSIKLRFEGTRLIGLDNLGIMNVILPSWSIGTEYSNLPELASDGPSGIYSRLSGKTLWTGAFTVPDSPPLMQIRRAFLRGSSGLIIYVLSGPSFTTEDLVYLESTGSEKPWEIKSSSIAGPLDVSAWAGQTIKLRIEGTGEVGFDDPAFNFVSSAVLGWSSPGSDQEHPSADDGDPFDTTSGSLTHRHTDLAIPGRGVSLEFSRSYSSMSTYNGDLGHRWSHNYAWALTIESDGDASVMYPSGGIARFDWDSGPQTFTAPAGNNDILVKNGDGTYTLTNRAQVKFNFASDGKLTSIADRNDNTTSLSYDVNDHLTTVTDPGGRTLTFSYDDPAYPDNITKITDPLPMPDTRTVEFTYDASGDLTQVKDVKGGTTTYAYSNHRMTSLTDSNSHVASQNIYDDANRVVEQADALNGVTCAYYGSGPAYTSAACPGVSPAPDVGETITVDPRGNKTTYSFDTSFRTTDVQDHLGNVVHYDFDANNNVTCVTDQRLNKTGYSYDSVGNVTQIIDALNTDANCQLKVSGVDWTFSYTANNDIDLETDPLGRQTDYIYDASGNLTRVVRKDAGAVIKALTCFERNTEGLMTALVESTDLMLPAGPTDPCTGNKTLFEYDTYGNQTAVVDPRFSGQPTPPKTIFTYDLGGRTLTVTNELSHTTTYTYDDQNNVLTVADNLGNTTSNTYDAKGNLETVTDANRQPVSAPETGAQWTQTPTKGIGRRRPPSPIPPCGSASPRPRLTRP
jgi:YD repeat-containing protein